MFDFLKDAPKSYEAVMGGFTKLLEDFNTVIESENKAIAESDKETVELTEKLNKAKGAVAASRAEIDMCNEASDSLRKMFPSLTKGAKSTPSTGASA